MEDINVTVSAGNLSSEWLFHNIAYNLNIRQDQAKDVDMEYTGDSRPEVKYPTKILEILGWE